MPVFVGGIVLVVQVLIDYDNRMLRFAAEQAEHVQRIEQLVDRRFAATSAATALYASVEATALKADNVTRLVESAARVGPHDELSRRFADHRINRLSPHRRIGIETRVLRQSRLDFLLQTNLVGFILFDKAASYELHSSSTLGSENRPAIVSVTLVVEPRRPAERRQRFETMREAARDE